MALNAATRLIGSLSLLTLASCRSPGSAAQSPAQIPPLDVCESPVTAQIRQRVTASHGGEEWSMQAVVEKAGCSLQVLFLTPAGSRALVIQQTGTRVETQAFIDRELPFPEENIVQDVFRIFFAEWSPSKKRDGTRVITTKRETYRDTYQGGALRAREVLLPGKTQPVLVITYKEGYGGGYQLRNVSATNTRYNYRLRIETQFITPPTVRP